MPIYLEKNAFFDVIYTHLRHFFAFCLLIAIKFLVKLTCFWIIAGDKSQGKTNVLPLFI